MINPKTEFPGLGDQHPDASPAIIVALFGATAQVSIELSPVKVAIIALPIKAQTLRV